MRVIVTRHINPPIPDRNSDWMAYFEGKEEGLVGYGPTEADAIADLRDKAETSEANAWPDPQQENANMKVLIGCEYSGRVREAFRALGHDAWSCDLLPSEDASDCHIQGDVLSVVGGAYSWDLMVAHPPCTHLSVSGARHFKEKRADGRQEQAIDFFLALANAPIPRIAIENPVCIMSSAWREPDQIIQPWQFGHGETKTTCLWLKGLPKLIPTDVVAGREQRVWKMPPGPNRWKERSRTYEGIAQAMARQWSNYTDLVTQAEAA